MTRFALLAAALCLAAGAAHAQWSWIDEKGVRQFSDRPPPANIPSSKILKAPIGGMDQIIAKEQSAAAASAPASASASASAAASAPKDWRAREADYKKRQKDAADKEKKEADEAAVKRENEETCAASRLAKQQLEAGVGRYTDADRAAQIARANKILATCN